ncbi:MAG: class I SAM-dependent methyltransferase [Myxococcales bacterium]
MMLATTPNAAKDRGICGLCEARLPVWQHVPVDHWKLRENFHSDAYWCVRCGYGSVQPMPSRNDVSEFYRFEQYYTHREPVQVRADEEQFLDRLRVHLAWRLDHGDPLTESHVHRALKGSLSRICDLGCGGGDLSSELRELGHTVVGVEVDAAAASRRCAGEVEILEGTAEELPAALRGRRFDCVILRHVLEHCREPARALANAFALLEPRGIMLCEVPNNAALGLRNVGCAWAMFDMPRHLHFFTRQSLMRVSEQAGFRVHEAYFANYHRQFENDWIESEQRIWSKLMGLSRKPHPAPLRNSRLRAWRQLITSAFMPAALKYDSVGVVAVRPA